MPQDQKLSWKQYIELDQVRREQDSGSRSRAKSRLSQNGVSRPSPSPANGKSNQTTRPKLTGIERIAGSKRAVPSSWQKVSLNLDKLTAHTKKEEKAPGLFNVVQQLLARKKKPEDTTDKPGNSPSQRSPKKDNKAPKKPQQKQEVAINDTKTFKSFAARQSPHPPTYSRVTNSKLTVTVKSSSTPERKTKPQLKTEQPRLAYSAKNYRGDDYDDNYLLIRPTHARAVVSKESVDRLSQPAKRHIDILIEDRLYQQNLQAERERKSTRHQRSLAEIHRIHQPRLAYSRPTKDDDVIKQEYDEYVEQKLREKRPINNDAIDRLSRPSERYLNQRRHHSEENTVSTKPKRHRILNSSEDSLESNKKVRWTESSDKHTGDTARKDANNGSQKVQGRVSSADAKSKDSRPTSKENNSPSDDMDEFFGLQKHPDIYGNLSRRFPTPVDQKRTEKLIKTPLSTRSEKAFKPTYSPRYILPKPQQPRRKEIKIPPKIDYRDSKPDSRVKTERRIPESEPRRQRGYRRDSGSHTGFTDDEIEQGSSPRYKPSPKSSAKHPRRKRHERNENHSRIPKGSYLDDFEGDSGYIDDDVDSSRGRKQRKFDTVIFERSSKRPPPITRHGAPGSDVVHERHIHYLPDGSTYEQNVIEHHHATNPRREKPSNLPDLNNRSPKTEPVTNSYMFDEDLDRRGKYRYHRTLNSKPKDRPIIARHYPNSFPSTTEYVDNSLPSIQPLDTDRLHKHTPRRGFVPDTLPTPNSVTTPSSSVDAVSYPEPDPHRRKKNDVLSDELRYDHIPDHDDSTSKNKQSEHRRWPIYRFDKDDELACLVKVSPQQLSKVKKDLKLVDRVPAELSRRLPSLPFIEFDTDETLTISPMQLVWENTSTRKPHMDGPLYILVPVDPDSFNDVTERMSLLYTCDLSEWRFSDGRIVALPINGKEHMFLEVLIDHRFDQIIFDVKARFKEDVKTVSSEGGELPSSVEPGLKVLTPKRAFDDEAIMKMRVEPLDINETDISLLIPSVKSAHAAAVSAVVKVTCSEPSKRPLSLLIPKPGQAVFGSHKLTLKCKTTELRNQHIHLFTKDKKTMRFQENSGLREVSQGYETRVNILKPGGCCYAFLVLSGTEPVGDKKTSPHSSSSANGEFLSADFLKRVSQECEEDEMKVRSLGRKLLPQNSTYDLLQGQNETDDLHLVVLKILRRWKNANRSTDENLLARDLIQAMHDAGLEKEALYTQNSYRDYMNSEEGSLFVRFFEELSMCPAVLVNWKSIGRTLGATHKEIRTIERDRPGLRRQATSMFKMAHAKLRSKRARSKDIFLSYIKALKDSGCPRIAASMEKKSLPKFYTDVI